MEFERIGRNTVQCHMTVEEMREYGLRIEDFFTNQEKSRDFLERLVERAEEEIGYEVESGMISMQLMRMPDDSLVITFSDRGEEGLQSMLNQIQNLAGLIDEGTAESIVNAMAREAGATSEESLHSEENMQEFEERLKNLPEEEAKKLSQKNRKKRSAAKVYRFEQFQALENFAASLEMTKTFPNKLYRDGKMGAWYLLVKKGKLKLEEYERVCHRLMEYGVLLTGQPFIEQYCKEHYEMIIGKQALQLIKEYQM